MTQQPNDLPRQDEISIVDVYKPEEIEAKLVEACASGRLVFVEAKTLALRVSWPYKPEKCVVEFVHMLTVKHNISIHAQTKNGVKGYGFIKKKDLPSGPA